MHASLDTAKTSYKAYILHFPDDASVLPSDGNLCPRPLSLQFQSEVMRWNHEVVQMDFTSQGARGYQPGLPDPPATNI